MSKEKNIVNTELDEKEKPFCWGDELKKQKTNQK